MFRVIGSVRIGILTGSFRSENIVKFTESGLGCMIIAEVIVKVESSTTFCAIAGMAYTKLAVWSACALKGNIIFCIVTRMMDHWQKGVGDGKMSMDSQERQEYRQKDDIPKQIPEPIALEMAL